VKNIETVHSFLINKNGLNLIDDPQFAIAVKAVTNDNLTTKEDLESQIKMKGDSFKFLCETYKSETLSEPDIELVLRSVGDNNAFISANAGTLTKMINYLDKYFDSKNYEKHTCLEIRFGSGGARLNHSHGEQYYYVKQTFILWREIMQDMFRLWYLAEEDLLDSKNSYRLSNTGQGLNRVQGAPRIGRAMQEILRKARSLIPGHRWIGSSVVHLGDNDVPNAMVFIDKYSQVPRIINPIVKIIEEIERLNNNNEELRDYFDSRWGGYEKLIIFILRDFFKHGFDGSGADNFFDAGSCIDGRLTSAWNWCSLLEKKEYSCVFYLCGFIGFDGDWRQ